MSKPSLRYQLPVLRGLKDVSLQWMLVQSEEGVSKVCQKIVIETKCKVDYERKKTVRTLHESKTKVVRKHIGRAFKSNDE